MSNLIDSATAANQYAAFADSVRAFCQGAIEPSLPQWYEAGENDRSLWKNAARVGLLGMTVPEELGGGGAKDYRYRAIVCNEVSRVDTSVERTLALADDVVLPYIVELGTREQREKWIPASCSGNLVGAIAMTEPSAGSDLRGISTTAQPIDHGGWLLNGTKTFVTCGSQADYLLVVARTGPPGTLSIFLVDKAASGVTVGQKLKKVGLHAQDTVEIAFADVELDEESLLGEAGQGMGYLSDRLPLERLSIAVAAACSSRHAFNETLQYVRDRKAFGKRLIDQQTIQFRLAEMVTEIEAMESYIDQAIDAQTAGGLSAIWAAKAKWWATEVQKSIVDSCVQLHGGYGYMLEHPIARRYVDARVQTIYGGATEIMKIVIGKSLATE